MKYLNTIGKILHRERKRNCLSLVDVEKLVEDSKHKIDRAYLSRIENGIVAPSLESLNTLKSIYNWSNEIEQAIEILLKGSRQKIRCKFISKQILDVKAEEILKECFGNTVCFPVKVETLVSHIGYNWEKKDLTELFDDDFFSLLIPDGHIYFGESKKIIVNSKIESLLSDRDKYSPQMQRMSLAHEVSHIVLGHRDAKASPPLFTRVKQEYEDYEWQATFFAGALLMPQKAVKQFINEIAGFDPRVVNGNDIFIDQTFKVNESSYTIVHYLMNIFDVSKSALETRLNHLGYILRFSFDSGEGVVKEISF